MSKGNAFENELLRLIFNNVDIPDIGDGTGLRGSLVAGNLYVSLHTADPGEAGTQATNETTYGSYARVGVERSVSGWTVSGNSVSNASEILFPLPTSGSGDLTHFAIGKSASGPQIILYKQAANFPLAISPIVQPRFIAGALVVSEE